MITGHRGSPRLLELINDRASKSGRLSPPPKQVCLSSAWRQADRSDHSLFFFCQKSSVSDTDNFQESLTFLIHQLTCTSSPLLREKSDPYISDSFFSITDYDQFEKISLRHDNILYFTRAHTNDI